MNYKFRKRPVVVEAFQMTEERRWNNIDWPEWLHRAWNGHPAEPRCLYCMPENNKELFISTLEGDYRVSWNDWIIQGVQGELYPCKPDIFEQTYEVADNE